MSAQITAPDDARLDELASRLTALSGALEHPDAWPAEQLKICADAGVFEWFLPHEQGGQFWSEADLLRAYVKLASACLTTTFVITQRMGAVQRIAAGESDEAKAELLQPLIAGHTFATVGISHLTTSRQHLARPVLESVEHNDGFQLNGYSPWVTGAEFAQHVVVGATLPDGRQVLICLPTTTPGVTTGPSTPLLGLSASRTGPVRCDQVFVPRKWLLAGPIHEVMKQGVSARTGGSQTSALAIGLATAAIDFLKQQSLQRGDLADPADSLIAERDALFAGMLAQAENPSSLVAISSHDLRVRANSLALRASQAALAAAKGAGYCLGHPTSRWCREALFFLVWSCPAPVLQANLCELACIQE